MKYHVEVMPIAEAANDAFIDFIANERQQPINAARVLQRIRSIIDRLESFPHAAGFAPENEYKDYEIRMRLVANCLLLFNVDEDSRTVRVIGFRHSSRLPRPDELPEDPSG